ncbi:MAG: glycosyltransferase [Actinobacteria bacterium]|nr:glycosyltransferase [Actinomycetota bacterium]
MISILIPVKDEPYIKILVKKIHNILKLKHEIILIDKSNFTPNVSRVRLIKQESDGLGNAILEGLRYAKGETIVVMDGDGSHRPEDIPRLLKNIDYFDVVIGSRFVKGGKTRDPQHRQVISLIFRKFASIILNLKIKDSMSGFAVFRRDIINKLQLKPIGYKIIMEILFKSKNYKICEVPIIFERRKSGKGKTNIKEALRTLKYIFTLRYGLK